MLLAIYPKYVTLNSCFTAIRMKLRNVQRQEVLEGSSPDSSSVENKDYPEKADTEPEDGVLL